MQYPMLIYSNENDDPNPGTPEGDKFMGAYYAFTEEVQQKKLMLGSNALQPVATATTVRVRDGKTQTTDGPFAETKEQLGGYYLLDCKDLDEAIEYAAKIPSAKHGAIEIRPISSLVSANGPSVVCVLPSRSRTVVAVETPRRATTPVPVRPKVTHS